MMNGLIDLHLHLDGSLSLETVRELAPELTLSDAELLQLLQVDANCRDLNEYLTKFDFPLSLLQTPSAIEHAVYKLCEELRLQGLAYAEIRFAPQLHLQQGLTQGQVVEAALLGLKHSTFPAKLILCCMRGSENHAQNIETIHTAAAYGCAVDLAGAEALFPTAMFEDLFQLAIQLNIPFTIHAGEADGPASVYTALKYGAKRIGHGVRSAEDPELMQLLVQQGVTLELCPTSNLNTQIFSSFADYPLRTLMDAGVKVTINTDNMTVSGTTLEREFQLISETFHLTDGEIRQLIQNAADAAF